MKRYVITKVAESDLMEILGFIADRDGVNRALVAQQTFVKAFELLASSPRIGARKPHITPIAIRWWPVFHFLVVYDASRDPISILRIIHGARDLDALFQTP